MLLGSRRLSFQARLSRPFGCVAIHGKNWSVAFVSSPIFTGRVHDLPAFLDTESLTSALVQGGLLLPSFVQEPLGKWTQATKIPPSGAMAAVGRLWEKMPADKFVSHLGSSFLSLKNPGLGREEATLAGTLQVMPPSVDFENLMLVGPVLRSKSA